MRSNFTKSDRLLIKAEYTRVFKARKVLRLSGLHVFYRQNKLNRPRIGLAVPKKNIAKSFSRNSYKRVLRERFRLSKFDLPGVDFVCVIAKNVGENRVLSEFNEAICFFKKKFNMDN